MAFALMGTYGDKKYYITNVNNSLSITSDVNRAFGFSTQVKANNVLSSLPKSFLKYHLKPIEIISQTKKEKEKEIPQKSQMDIDMKFDYTESMEIPSILEDVDSTKINVDKLIDKSDEQIKQLKDLIETKDTVFQKKKQECLALFNELSRLDKELVDISHYIEFHKVSASKGYMLHKMERDRLLRRRKVKDLIITYKLYFNSTTSTQYKKILDDIKKIDTQQYKPRTELYDEIENMLGVY